MEITARTCFVFLFLIALTTGQIARSSDAEFDPATQARIDFESAKLLIKQGNFAIADRKLDSVQKILGDDPHLLVLRAQCNEKPRPDIALDYAKKALSSQDDAFRMSPDYQLGLEIAARLGAEKESKNCLVQVRTVCHCRWGDERWTKQDFREERDLCREGKRSHCDTYDDAKQEEADCRACQQEKCGMTDR